MEAFLNGGVGFGGMPFGANFPDGFDTPFRFSGMFEDLSKHANEQVILTFAEVDPTSDPRIFSGP